MPEDVFKLLRRIVGHVRKRAECRDINKITLVETACVTGKRLARQNILRGLDKVFRDAERGGKIICAARWDIAERFPVPGRESQKAPYTLV